MMQGITRSTTFRMALIAWWRGTKVRSRKPSPSTSPEVEKLTSHSRNENLYAGLFALIRETGQGLRRFALEGTHGFENRCNNNFVADRGIHHQVIKRTRGPVRIEVALHKRNAVAVHGI